jgi:hypothetical protein
MLATPHDVTNFTPRLSPRAERREGTRLASRICPGSSDGSAFAIESGSDFGFSRNLGDPGPPTGAAVPFSAGNSVTRNRRSADFTESAGEPDFAIGINTHQR